MVNFPRKPFPSAFLLRWRILERGKNVQFSISRPAYGSGCSSCDRQFTTPHRSVSQQPARDTTQPSSDAATNERQTGQVAQALAGCASGTQSEIPV
jgi:hypothetical protein